jgi:hypothetical protein
MKTTTQKFGNDEVEYIKLTYDEELSMARWVINTLCLPWIETREDFYAFLRRMYLRKCSGRDFEAWHLVDLYKKYQHYYQYEEDLELSPIPVFKEDGQCISGIVAKKDISRAWREVWEEHPEFKKKIDFAEVFPDGTTSQDYADNQDKLEREFWSRVGEIQKKFNCTQNQAVIEVTDYMPRGKVY